MLAVSLFATPVLASAPTYPSEAQNEPTQALNTPEAISAYVKRVQASYGLSDAFYDTLECESAGWQNIQSEVPDPTGPNGREDSWGVAQIWLDQRGHPNVTRAQALDVRFAVKWAAERFKKNPTMWHCYKKVI